MRLFADTNIVRAVVVALRAAGHDVVYGAERRTDPGDIALLREAHAERRRLISKDHDMGVLVFRDREPHAGVILIDDLGDPDAETALILGALARYAAELEAGAFIRVEPSGARIVWTELGS